ncbi:unnamed protein product [Symbiodinium microadriaticum]|nr:unnamed protein product [Symbiodinium microadriaticum]
MFSLFWLGQEVIFLLLAPGAASHLTWTSPWYGADCFDGGCPDWSSSLASSKRPSISSRCM